MDIVRIPHVVNLLMVWTNYVVELDIRNTKLNSVEIFSRDFVNTVLVVNSYISQSIQTKLHHPIPFQLLVGTFFLSRSVHCIRISLATVGTYLLRNILALGLGESLAHQSALAKFSLKHSSIPFTCASEMHQLTPLHFSYGISLPQNQNNNNSPRPRPTTPSQSSLLMPNAFSEHHEKKTT